MTRARLLPFCLLPFSIVPFASFAQSNVRSLSMLDNSDTVSVHRLSIPEKARKAYNEGVRRLNAQDWNASVAKFQRAIRLFPAFFEAYNELGNADLGLQSWNDAEAAFRESIELSGGAFAAPHFGFGLVLSHRNQFADAEAMIRQGLALSPEDARGNFCLAWVLYSMGQLAGAEQSAREAIVHNPAFPEPYLLLAQIDLVRRSFSAEIQDLNGYLELDSSSPRSARARAARADALHALAAENATARVIP
jgi:tetratricopeptide (TPR) repeat protein